MFTNYDVNAEPGWQPKVVYADLQGGGQGDELAEFPPS